MRILLDTCDFLWFITGNPSLPATRQSALRDPENQVYLSVVSLWEICVKHALGKLPLPEPPETFIPAQRDAHGIDSLNLREDSVFKLSSLPGIHRDPFDRMILCQCLDHGMVLATGDEIVRRYPVPLL